MEGVRLDRFADILLLIVQTSIQTAGVYLLGLKATQ